MAFYRSEPQLHYLPTMYRKRKCLTLSLYFLVHKINSTYFTGIFISIKWCNVCKILVQYSRKKLFLNNVTIIVANSIDVQVRTYKCCEGSSHLFLSSLVETFSIKSNLFPFIIFRFPDYLTVKTMRILVI